MLLLYIPPCACILSPSTFTGAPAGTTLSEMARVFRLVIFAALATRSIALTYGPSSYAPSGAFPTSLYNSYYNDPTATSAQPQPVISDPVLVRICAVFCKALDVLMYVCSTRYIRLGSPVRTTYPRCVISLHSLRYCLSFSRRMTPRTPILSRLNSLVRLSCKPP